MGLYKLVNAYMTCGKNYGKDRANRILSYYIANDHLVCYEVPEELREDCLKSFIAGKVVKDAD